MLISPLAAVRRAMLIALPALVLLGTGSFALAAQPAIDKPALDSYLAAQVGPPRIPGMVAMVVDAKQTLYLNAFGKQDVAGNVTMRPDTIFRLASMTKPVTSAAIMMLVDDGKLGVDDPVSKYLPEYKGKPVIDKFDAATGKYTTRPAAREVTLKHLLTHTSGLGYAFANTVLTKLQEGTPPNTSSQQFPLLFDPGTRWQYGESTRVLGTVVEKVSGKGLEQFLRERIFVPLGMNETWYTIPAAKNARTATIHRSEGGKLVETPNPPGDIVSPPNGDGGLNSTAADYAKFIQLFLNKGVAPNGKRLLSEKSLALMSSGQTGNVLVQTQQTPNLALSKPFPVGAGRDRYGLGFQVTEKPAIPGCAHPGSLAWAGIFNTEFWIDPAAGIGGILLMQYLPFYDDAAIETLQGFEKRIYGGAPK